MYSYGDSSWLDLLTAYDGQSISYDSIGNPTSWYDGTTFTWSNGRRLTSAVNSSTGLNNSYTYDMDGLRLTKTVGSVEHKYVWQGSKLVAEYFGGTELEFFYDENGAPYAFSYKATASATPVMYYYVTNLQGDVVSILNAGGTSVAEYSYNAWGKVLSATGTMAAINPIRYRGYYFDSDSGLYYLKSRYYDPNLQRFINSDDIASTGQGFIGTNTFAYCLNNPLIYVDVDGTSAGVALGILTGLTGGAAALVAIATVAGGIALVAGMAVATAWIAHEISTLVSPPRSAITPTDYEETIANQLSAKFELCETRSYKSAREKHHIVAQRSRNAIYARYILNDLNIGINSEANTVDLKTGLHRRLHTSTYYSFTNTMVISAYNSAIGDRQQQEENVYAVLKKLKDFLQALDAAAPY